jgi:hypothetical protein
MDRQVYGPPAHFWSLQRGTILQKPVVMAQVLLVQMELVAKKPHASMLSVSTERAGKLLGWTMR